METVRDSAFAPLSDEVVGQFIQALRQSREAANAGNFEERDAANETLRNLANQYDAWDFRLSPELFSLTFDAQDAAATAQQDAEANG